jgi:hypothetical protein
MAQTKQASKRQSSEGNNDLFDVAQQSVAQIAAASLASTSEVGKITQSFYSGYVKAYQAGVSQWLEAQREWARSNRINTSISADVEKQVAAVTTAWIDGQKTALQAWSSIAEQVTQVWVNTSVEVAKANASIMRTMQEQMQAAQKAPDRAQ